MTRRCEGNQSYPCTTKITVGIRCAPCSKIHSRIRDRDQKRAKLDEQKPLPRTCLGYPNHTCDVSLEGEHVLKKRCHTCKGKNDSMMQRLYGRSGRRTPRAKPLTREQSEWQGFTDAQRTARIVDGIRWGVSAGELAETYGITRAEVRSINCAHYQRRARIAA